MPERAEVVENVRRLSGVAAGRGPDDAHLFGAMQGFMEVFDYWYVRVMRETVADYRDNIVKRINPFIRRIEFEGLGTDEVTARLVEDYNARNFVTAGGWALEELAVNVSMESQKSPAEGIDLQRHDPATGDYHLYVLKSGLVTRNSDIIKSLKANARQAERLLRQGRSTGSVHLNYAILAGKTTSSFADGVRRPASAEFWSEMLRLPEDEAIEVVLAIAAEAGRLVRPDVSQNLAALRLVVGNYIAERTDPTIVDWEFIAKRNLRARNTWAAEDRERHRRALAALEASGYEVVRKVARSRSSPPRGRPKARS